LRIFLVSDENLNGQDFLLGMKDSDCIDFLQWALPQLRMRWPGFRQVRKQVRKRIDRRRKALGLPDVTAYRGYLKTNPDEWSMLDSFCRISISRFYRDRGIFDRLRETVLPKLAEMVLGQGENGLHCWSIGCASGEEPYTLSLIWRLSLQSSYPALTCRILATDADEQLLQRAQTPCYPASSLSDLPQEWRAKAFVQADEEYCLRETFRSEVEFQHQDIRQEQPAGSFHLILCRNLILTYFEESRQAQGFVPIIQRLPPGGALVIGKKEHLPHKVPSLRPWFPKLGIYRRA
jgi:chemotaxis protein methyltransferase CheR